MEQVALLRCKEYDTDRIEEALRRGFDFLGGETFLRRLIPPGTRVLLKPNLLSQEPPGSLVVTDHRVFEAVIRILKDYAGTITFGDSPGLGSSRRAAESCGLMEVAFRYGVAFDPFEEWIVGKVEDPLLCPTFDVARAAMDTDVLITLPRLKTHAMMSYTGAVKNQFGCVSGLKKAAWHSRMPRPEDFARMLLDLNHLVKPRLAILDGIVAMEGNGPKNGTGNPMETLIIGESITAVDTLAATLIGHDPQDIPYLRQALIHHRGTAQMDGIRVLGEDPETMKPENFQRIRGKSHMSFSNQGIFQQVLTGILAPRPVLTRSRCIRCRQCGKICPERPDVISFTDGYPQWNMDCCIRCFCCQEICPAGAIYVKHPPLARLLKIK